MNHQYGISNGLKHMRPYFIRSKSTAIFTCAKRSCMTFLLFLSSDPFKNSRGELVPLTWSKHVISKIHIQLFALVVSPAQTTNTTLFANKSTPGIKRAPCLQFHRIICQMKTHQLMHNSGRNWMRNGPDRIGLVSYSLHSYDIQLCFCTHLFVNRREGDALFKMHTTS